MSKNKRLRVAVGLSGGVDPSSTLTSRRALRARPRRARLRGTVRRVAMGLSGGVDSAVSAALLQEQGYEVTGVFLECWKEPGCRTDQDRKDALRVALELSIPFQVLDFRREYKKRVVDYFYREYKAGRTPNPDTMCNREIKFGLFYDWAMEEGFDYVATGHYARIARKTQNTQRIGESDGQMIRASGDPTFRYSGLSDPAERGSEFSDYRLLRGIDEKKDPRKVRQVGQRGKQSYQLLRGLDERKDQSYFLYQLKSDQLEHILFPVGHLTKSEVRREAQRRGLSVAAKPDSQGICFIGDVDVQELLRQRLAVKKGEVVVRKSTRSTKGTRGTRGTEGSDYEVVGEHDGVWFYTIGQRHGFRINQKSKIKNQKFKHTILPLYVIEKEIERNRLVVGFGAETYTNQFKVDDLNWLSSKFKVQSSKWTNGIRTRIRHGGQLIASEWKVAPKYTYLLPWSTSTRRKSVTLGLRRLPRRVRVRLLEPQRGIAPGQAAVFYGQDDEVLGGGVIQ